VAIIDVDIDVEGGGKMAPTVTGRNGGVDLAVGASGGLWCA